MKTLFVVLFMFSLVVWAGLAVAADFKLTSTAFQDDTDIPKKYTCNSDNISPPLTFENIPAKTQSLALTVADPDSPRGLWTHWVVYNIPANTAKIAENSNPGTEGVNSFGKHNYGGPCPPDEKTHHYLFHAYALDAVLDISEGPGIDEVKAALQGHIIAQTQLVGTYHKPS